MGRDGFVSWHGTLWAMSVLAWTSYYGWYGDGHLRVYFNLLFLHCDGVWAFSGLLYYRWVDTDSGVV